MIARLRKQPSSSVVKLRLLGLLAIISTLAINAASTDAAQYAQIEKATFVLAFVPVNWSGSLDEFDQAAAERAALFLDASGIKAYTNVEVKVIHDILWDDLNNDQLHSSVARFGAEREAADIYIGLTDGDVMSDTHIAGWTTFGGNGIIGEVASAPNVVAHELGHVFYLCDEYNSEVWEEQNTRLLLRGGCPNPYPEECDKCTTIEGACCLGWPTADGGYCIMGPANTNNRQYGQECLTPLHEAFVDRFGSPLEPTAIPPEATSTLMATPVARMTITPFPTSLTATSTPKPVPTLTPTPISRPFSFSAIVEKDGRLQLMIVDSAGAANIVALPVEGNVYAVAWQTGGQQAVLSVSSEANLDLYLWKPSSNDLTSLARTLAHEAQPVWHPFLEEIIFVSDETGDNDLYSMDMKTQAITRLTDTPGNEQGPAISPDGRLVSYSYELDGHISLALLELETGIITYPEIGVEAIQPSWSFDGELLAFASVYENDWDIVIWHLDTDLVERLTYGGGQHLAPAWLPDGRLLFQAFQDQHWTIYLMGPDGSRWQQVVPADSNVRAPAYVTSGR